MALLTNLFGLEQIDNNKILDTSLISEEINRELEEYLLEKKQRRWLNWRRFWICRGFIQTHTKRIWQINWWRQQKKQFIKALTRIFALLLNTKVETADKIKEILKIAVEMTLKI